MLTVDETQRLLSLLPVTSRLIERLLYGGGLRLTEYIRLRVKDADFFAGQIIVRYADIIRIKASSNEQ